MDLLRDNPNGRLDIAAVRVAEFIVRGPLEKACNGLPLWDGLGLGRVIEAVVAQAGVPNKPIDAMDFARALGLVPAQQNNPQLKGSGRRDRRSDGESEEDRNDVKPALNAPTHKRRYVRS